MRQKLNNKSDFYFLLVFELFACGLLLVCINISVNFFFLISINVPVILLTKLVSSYNTCMVESNSLSEFLVVDLKI